MRPRLTVGVSVARTYYGATSGYKDGDIFTFLLYTSEYSMNSVAAVLNWHPTARVRLGGGPALHRAQYTDSMSDIPRGTASRSGPGLVGQAGFAWFNGERMFSELTAEYSLAPSMDRPEVVVTNPGFNGITSTATLPAASISYSQWSVGISFGVKLWR